MSARQEAKQPSLVMDLKTGETVIGWSKPIPQSKLEKKDYPEKLRNETLELC